MAFYTAIAILISYGFLRGLIIGRYERALFWCHPSGHCLFDAFLSLLLYFLFRGAGGLKSAFAYSYVVESYMLYAFPLLPLWGSRVAVLFLPRKQVFSMVAAYWLWEYARGYSYLYLCIAMLFSWSGLLDLLQPLRDLGVLEISEDFLKYCEARRLEFLNWPAGYPKAAETGLFCASSVTFIILRYTWLPLDIMFLAEEEVNEHGEERIVVSVEAARYRSLYHPLGALWEPRNVEEEAKKLILAFQRRILCLRFWIGWTSLFAFFSTWMGIVYGGDVGGPSDEGEHICILVFLSLMPLGFSMRLYWVARRAGIPFLRAVKIWLHVRRMAFDENDGA